MIAAIKAANTKVIRVGHSMGGMVVTGVAEAIPEQVEKLVYVAGFLPANGHYQDILSQHQPLPLLIPAGCCGNPAVTDQ